MSSPFSSSLLALLLGALFFCPLPSWGQKEEKIAPTPTKPDSSLSLSSSSEAQVIFPQRPSFRLPLARSTDKPVLVTHIQAHISLQGPRATTELRFTLKNPNNRPVEGVLLLPMPPNATVTNFSYGTHQGQFNGSLLDAKEARRLYDEIVRQVLDPALLEFAGYGALKSSVFPLAPQAEIPLCLTYEEVLTPFQRRYSYILPRSELLESEGSPAWSLRVELNSDKNLPVSSRHRRLYSPTHEMKASDLSQGTQVLVNTQKTLAPGPFMLSYPVESTSEQPYTLFACPDKNNPHSGYFMVILDGEKISKTSPQKPLPRHLLLALDRSGSMRGEKWDQVKAATRQLIQNLRPEDSFNIITYNEACERFSSHPLQKSPDTEKKLFTPLSLNPSAHTLSPPLNESQLHHWLESLQARGGTFISGALSSALAQPVPEGKLPLCLFLTDGRPTLGELNEKRLLSLAKEQNTAHYRLFTLGLGQDAHIPLLRSLAQSSRALPTVILPKEKVDQKMQVLFAQLEGPLLYDLSWQETGSVRQSTDVLPTGDLPDVYAGAPLFLLGRYSSTQPFTLQIRAKDKEQKEHCWDIEIAPERLATLEDNFVARLWAARKIASLEQLLLEQGLSYDSPLSASSQKETRELWEEILRLSFDFGILSPFSAFFADDGSRASLPSLRTGSPNTFSSASPLRERSAADYLLKTEDKAAALPMLFEQSGERALAQGRNYTELSEQKVLNKKNIALNAEASPSSSLTNTPVLQLSQYTLYQEATGWKDSSLFNQKSSLPKKTVRFGSPEYEKVRAQLITQNAQALLALRDPVEFLLGQEIICLENTPSTHP